MLLGPQIAMRCPQSVRRHTGGDGIDLSVELGPGRGAAYRPWLNKRHALGLRLSLTVTRSARLVSMGPASTSRTSCPGRSPT